MPNLAHELPPPQGQVVQFPKKERPVMSDQDEGYTKTPNYLVDDDYIALMTGNALKCYVVINRFTGGFSRKEWAIASAFLLEKTGIKKPHTAYDALKQLEEMELLKVHREDGKTNKFTITNPCLKTEVVPKNGTGSENGSSAENGHRGSAEKRHNTSAENGHTKKERFKKEKIKERDKEDNAQEPEKFSTQNRPLNFVEYHPDDKTQISFRDLCKKYPAQLDFQQQAKTNFPNHSPELIFETLKKMAQWSLDKSNHTPQKWMSIWLSTFMKNEKTDAEVAAAAERKAARAAKAQDKPQVRSRFGQYLKPQQEIRDV